MFMFMYNVPLFYSITTNQQCSDHDEHEKADPTAHLINTLIGDLRISALGFLIACLRIHKLTGTLAFR